MKKNKLVLISFIILSMTANSQITKNNWLVGGNGRLALQEQTLNSFDVKGLNINLSPNVGYFFIDKLAGGIRTRLAFDKVEFNGGVTKTTQTGIGPFFRYYFLEQLNRVNLFSETAYQYTHNSGNNVTSNSSNTFTFSVGPAIYFNSSVGIELTANYEIFSNKSTNTSAKTFFLALGFQIHLEKEKNY
jgi:hypothetical protein